MALCEGCQEFRRYLFIPKDDFPGKEVCVSIHKSFAELLKCAESCCDLCKFFRRELCLTYDWKPGAVPLHEEDFEAEDHEVVIIMGWMCLIDSHPWKITCGGLGDHDWRSAPIHHNAIFPKNLCSQVTSSKQLVEMSHRWLAACQNEHHNCTNQKTQIPAFLPTRLLDVGPSEQHAVRLVSCDNLSKVKRINYLTLSYCWGTGNDAARTTVANLDDRLKEIPISPLPRTIQDAIILTRAFGLRYLWVDALCIIQDAFDSNDWRSELLNMGRIYRHSLFTIAASSAADSSMGFLHRREVVQWPVEDFYLSRDDESGPEDMRVKMEAEIPSWYNTVDSSVLSNRGWVLQERMLASRTLHWTQDGVFWECNDARASEWRENDKSHERSPVHLRMSEVVSNIRSHGFLVKKRRYSEQPVLRKSLWSNLIEKFSRKSLTSIQDRLPAVTGLGQELARLTRTDFELGVFKHNLVQELAWVAGFQDEPIDGRSVVAKQQTVRVPRLPSWCWASAHGPLLFRPSQDQAQFRELSMDIRLSEERVQVRSRLGSLRVRTFDGAAIHPTLAYGVASFPASPYTFKPLIPCTNTPIRHPKPVFDEIAVFDTLSEALPVEGGIITCIQWLNWTPGSYDADILRHITVTGAIIIAPTGEGSNVYRRIGWLEVFDATFFDEEPQDIVLV